MDADGPGEITHIWITIAHGEAYHLKRIVLRMYWDRENSPSVEAPIGDSFGLGLGNYYLWQSKLLSVGADKALNCLFPIPFAKRARITLTNEGKEKLNAHYYNLDYHSYTQALQPGTLYFHAQFCQAQPNLGWTNQ